MPESANVVVANKIKPINKSMMKKLQILFVCLLAALGLKAVELKSPDGNLVLQAEVKNGRPVYALNYARHPEA